MSKKSSKKSTEVDSIPNWTIWHPVCTISLWKDLEDDTYNAAIDLILSAEDENMRCITTMTDMTDIWCKDPLCVIRQAYESVSNLYECVSDDVNVISFKDGNPLDEEYTIDEALEVIECKVSSNVVSVEM